MAHGEHFTWSRRYGVAVVCPPSELDISKADRLQDCCRAATDACGPWVVVDLAGTTFLDSTALNTFVQIGKQAESEGGWLRLASGDSPTVRKVLEITLMDAQFGNYRSVESAILRRVSTTRPRRLGDRDEAS